MENHFALLADSSVVMLLLVFAPVIGIGRKGAHRWIGLPHMPHFQPSELAKLSLILFLAAYGDRYQRQMAGFRQGLLIPGCIMAVVLALIFVEPDRGCTILLAMVGGDVDNRRCAIEFFGPACGAARCRINLFVFTRPNAPAPHHGVDSS